MAEVEASRSIDTGRLSLFLDIDVPDLQAILDSANEGLVFLLQQVLAKALEYDKISNAKEVLEVDYSTIYLEIPKLIFRSSRSYLGFQSEDSERTTPEVCQ